MRPSSALTMLKVLMKLLLSHDLIPYGDVFPSVRLLLFSGELYLHEDVKTTAWTVRTVFISNIFPVVMCDVSKSRNISKIRLEK